MASPDQTSPDPSTTARRRRIAATVLVAVLAAVLVAVVVERSGGEKVINAGGKTKILVNSDHDESAAASASGVLADVGGCLGITGAGDADDSYVVIWPHGTNVDVPDPLRVKVDGRTYGIGDTIELGGGYGGPLGPSSYFYDQVPKACRTADVFRAG